MSLKNKLFAGALTVSAFAVAGMAQDATPEAKEAGKDKATKVERKADRGGRGMRGGAFGRHGGGLGRHLLGIELTDQQKTQIKEILQAAKPDAAVMQETRAIMRAKFEGTASDAQNARLTELKRQGFERGLQVKAQLDAVLTPEQKEQIKQRKQEMKAKMVEMGERFKEHHDLFLKNKAARKPDEVKKDN